MLGYASGIQTTILTHACTLSRLEYNEASNSYHNRSGVDIKVVGFGTTCRSEYMYADGPDWKCDTWPLFKYFHDFVDYFVENVDYKRDHTIRAAPYDWRLTPGTCVHVHGMQCATV